MNDYFGFTEAQQNYLEKLQKYNDDSLSIYAAKSSSANRLYKTKDVDYLRSDFSVDVDKILHNVLYNRYTDKTQVFSFFKNDDISRRAIHVQLVSRIAYIIGKALRLNTDLIQAIALGHDIGHTPFGHKGEEFLNELSLEYAGRHFSHNVHSVRVLMLITQSNLTLQTYNGILLHCGEKVHGEYRPHDMTSFDDFTKLFWACYADPNAIDALHPSTLEGCVVRLSDMIAYVGKDRQDAYKAGIAKSNDYSDHLIGNKNKDIINNIIINVIKNSIDKDYIKLDTEVADSLKQLQKENFDIIYGNRQVTALYYDCIRPMMKLIYEKLRDDIKNNNFSSPVYKHHLNHSILGNFYRDKDRHIIASTDDIIIDYIASMTDDYFIDLFRYLYPDHPLNDQIVYHEYFDDCNNV